MTDFLFRNVTEEVGKYPFTLSARMARLSLRAKNPDTGPVWWYLKATWHNDTFTIQGLVAWIIFLNFFFSF